MVVLKCGLAESLLPRCVPDLHRDGLVLEFDRLLDLVNACRADEVLCEVALRVAVHQGGFSNVRIPDEQQLYEEV